ncbi:two-component system, NtrC family, nitrogen regulation response regulator NtrX [Desulfonauticus submarinus]|uniref:Two-component system, NtrC family, nitrogen regulation response regulator NtrX n=1 Tax=Desulfonauticus submarinus TaxID=206665 RepID=A0A1H0EBX2_9BACT|nr:sigma-54 dependent transcriptional regulator [Desulfonauticus submarinus]SDN79855.1 two-component system, NtrC family, nitrogen regulation response regulator NtrX [Desulfonauticus submarinus]
MPRILIIDDEEDIRFSLKGILEDEGYEVIEVPSGEEGLELIFKVDLVFLDIWLPGIDGIEVLKKIHEVLPDLPVVMISGHGTIETAVQAIKIGAYDFIEKPLSLEKVLLVVEKGLELARLRQENRELKSCLSHKVSEVSGNSYAIKKLKKLIRQVAPTDAWVLITGENGTGKEIVARSIHRQSKRASKPLVAVNCAAIPEELIESELFGHEKGAFTGAVEAKKGKFELADGGTLFLDEIGDMSLKTQAKILRILQEQRFERVGGNKTIQVDVRVIAATNKDLEEEIKKGNFRQDLYFRLKVFPLEVPPLRERKEDIPILIDEFIQFLSQEHNFKPLKFSKECLSILKNYPWPGNVRELKNFIERMFILYQGKTIFPEDLPGDYLTDNKTDHQEQTEIKLLTELPKNFKQAKSEFEKCFLAQRLKEVNGNITELAKLIGLERTYLYKKLKYYNLLK